MTEVHVRKWKPFDDLPTNWQQELNDVQTLTMVKAWREQAQELRDQELYKEFLERLQREWAIETGAIEGVYTLSEGATFQLIEKGLHASLISYEDTDDSPEVVIARIQDQHRAIRGLQQFLDGDRPLGTSYIKELHRILTEHQDTYVARDTLGNLVTRQLPKGTYKSLPNNVEHFDGTVFEYCPPEHVDAEMERLVALYDNHQALDVPPHVESAWLHHRFTLIHPFTDGNGRVARCLATLVLLKANWLPLVITRRDRAAYIDVLRSADNGDLRPLVEFTGKLQRKAVREALSLSERVLEESAKVSTVLAEVREKFNKRRVAEANQIQRAFRTADSLQKFASDRLGQVAEEVHETVRAGNTNYWAALREGCRGTPRANYNYHQIVLCAKELNYYANLPVYQAWAALVIVTDERSEILFSFHGIGHRDAGILGCSSMFYSKEIEEPDTGTAGRHIVREVTPLDDSPFEFNYLDDPTDVQTRFSQWLDKCIIRGLDQWRNVV